MAIRQKPVDQIAGNESGCAGDEDLHHAGGRGF
jgi:hypothetical protein